MATRPLIRVFSNAKQTPKETYESLIKVPAVLRTPLRPDLVRDVVMRMGRNRRQAYAVSEKAGHQTSAESWGTGRAVARIPRVPGGGTHRAGQGAFGNMCRGGRIFAPTKIWRRWHRKINISEKRYALASALAATAVPALVMARGHKIEQLNEVPVVVDSKLISAVTKTSQAKALLQSLGALEDVQKSKDSHKIRTGKGKYRNRRYVQRRGPLVIYSEKGSIERAFRNLPGVDTACVERLNLLQLAPGGHLGRFCIWTKDAFERLETIWGNETQGSSSKVGYTLPRTIMTTGDLQRIINSNEIQSVLRAKKTSTKFDRKVNPLKSTRAMLKLNPHAVSAKRSYIKAQLKRTKEAADRVAAGKKAPRPERFKKANSKQRKTVLKKFKTILLSK